MKAILDNSTNFFFSISFFFMNKFYVKPHKATQLVFSLPLLCYNKTKQKKTFSFSLSLSLFLNHSNQTWCNRVSVSHIGIWSNRPST